MKYHVQHIPSGSSFHMTARELVLKFYGEETAVEIINGQNPEWKAVGVCDFDHEELTMAPFMLYCPRCRTIHGLPVVDLEEAPVGLDVRHQGSNGMGSAH